ncbi:hypothetical protein MMPV_005292 [Pyropia vietnamensis]
MRAAAAGAASAATAATTPAPGTEAATTPAAPPPAAGSRRNARDRARKKRRREELRAAVAAAAAGGVGTLAQAPALPPPHAADAGGTPHGTARRGVGAGGGSGVGESGGSGGGTGASEAATPAGPRRPVSSAGMAPAATATAPAAVRGAVGRTSVAATLAHLRRAGELTSPPDLARRAAAIAEAQTNEAVVLTTDGREVRTALPVPSSAETQGGKPMLPCEGDLVETVAGTAAAGAAGAAGVAGAAATNAPAVGRVMSADADEAGGWVLWGGGGGSLALPGLMSG